RPHTLSLHDALPISEWLRAQRVEALLPFRPHAHEPCLVEDAKVPRDARLLNVHGFHECVHGALACPERLHNPTTRRIGEDLEYNRFHAGCIHVCVYTLFCISRAIARVSCSRGGRVSIRKRPSTRSTRLMRSSAFMGTEGDALDRPQPGKEWAVVNLNLQDRTV